MLTGFLRAFRTPDLRRKLLFTVFIIAMFRLGAALPIPGVSEHNVNVCLNQASNSSGGPRWLPGTTRVAPFRSEKSSSMKRVLATSGLSVQKST